MQGLSVNGWSHFIIPYPGHFLFSAFPAASHGETDTGFAWHHMTICSLVQVDTRVAAYVKLLSQSQETRHLKRQPTSRQ